jgi:hypothetical protein
MNYVCRRAEVQIVEGGARIATNEVGLVQVRYLPLSQCERIRRIYYNPMLPLFVESMLLRQDNSRLD